MVLAFHCPTRIVHGVGALERLGAAVSAAGIARPMLVTDPIIVATDACRLARDALETAGIDYLIFEDTAVDARVSHIQDQAERARAERVDGVIGIGGGSAMCTAKGIACMAVNTAAFRISAASAAFPNRPCRP
jgi:alcohol dehydrogenase class IV